MTLYDLSLVLADNFAVVVYGSDADTEVGRYDGVNSIDEKYEDCEVVDIYPNGEHELCVCIDDDDVMDDDDEDDDIEYRDLRDME